VISLITTRLSTALLRESLALVEAGIASTQDIDLVVKNTIGRRLAVGGPFEIWEQIGWDLVQTIAGELFKEISNAKEPSVLLRKKVETGELGEKTDRGFYKWPRPLGTNVPDRVPVPSGIQNIAVIGAGLMGHGIALEFASHGYSVFLYDLTDDLLNKAMIKVRAGLAALAQAGTIPVDQIDTALSRITTTINLVESLQKVDLIIEAASENLELKQSLFAQFDATAPPNAILASNTSTFLPSAMASATRRPSQVAGTHYYNPPHLLPGIEIVRGSETSNHTADLLMNLYRSIGKKPALIQKEIQGFIGNRLQVAVLREAMSLVEQGHADANEIDTVVRTGLGKSLSATGPFELADRQGLDSVLESMETTLPSLSIERELPRTLLDKIESGDLGTKTGRGFYEWTPESIEAWRKNMADSLLDMAARDQ